MNGTLDEVLIDIAHSWGFDADELIGYAHEDMLGGHYPQALPGACHPAPIDHPGRNKGIWETEGQTLYALIRALKPRNVLEIGNRWYCSTAHIAEALLKNGQGHLWTMDIQNEPILRDEHKEVATQIVSDLFWFDYAKLAPIDFIFEDSFHQPDMVEYVWRKFLEHGSDKGMVVSHDSEHFRVGPRVKEGLARVGLPYTSYQITPAECGLAMYRRANVHTG